MPGVWPTSAQNAANRDPPIEEAEKPKPNIGPDREAFTAAGGRGDDRGEQARTDRERNADQSEVDDSRHRPRDQAHLVGLSLVSRPAQQAVDELLGRVVHLLGDAGEAVAHVGDQSHPLLGYRRPYLWRLRDPLHEHLRLGAGQDLLPDAIGQLTVERVDHRLGHLVARQRLLQRALDGVLLHDHAHDRPLDRGTAEGADYGLLGGVLDRPVDAGGAGQALCSARASAEHAGGGRARTCGALRSAVAVGAHLPRL